MFLIYVLYSSLYLCEDGTKGHTPVFVTPLSFGNGHTLIRHTFVNQTQNLVSSNSPQWRPKQPSLISGGPVPASARLVAART